MPTTLRRILPAIATVALTLFTGVAPAQTSGRAEVVDRLARLLDDRPVLALCENHWNQNIHELIGAMIESDAFTDRCDVIVIEWATATHQALVDAYVRGDEVSDEALAAAWRDVPAVHLPWESPVYPGFFRRVRDRNAELRRAGSDRQLRVLAADPAIRWDQIRTRDDYIAFVNEPSNERDAHAAAVIEREVLGLGLRALVLAGSGHLTRRNLWDPPDPHPSPDTTTVILERHHPGSTRVVLTLHAELLGRPGVAEAVAGLTPPSLIGAEAGRWSGVSASDLSTIRRYNAPPGEARPYPGLRADQIADLVLYVAASGDLRTSVPSVEFARGIDFETYNAHRAVLGQGPVGEEDVLAESAEILNREKRYEEAVPVWEALRRLNPDNEAYGAGLAEARAG